MLVIVASRFDRSAVELARRWGRYPARLLTCASLSQAGWCFDPSQPAAGTFVADGEVLPTSGIGAVVSLLPAVHSGELTAIAETDAAYVAAEMMAFLVAWLSALPCKVVGRATPLCLTGPYLRQEQWACEAQRAGLVVAASERSGTGGVPGSGAASIRDAPIHRRSLRQLSIIAGQVLVASGESPVPDAVALAAATLVRNAGLDLATVTLEQVDDTYCFVGATPTVDVSDGAVVHALEEAVGAVTGMVPGR